MRYFDLHCDTISECCLKNKSLYDNDLHISLKKAENYSPWVQTFAVWMPDTVRGDAAWQRFLKVAETFKTETAKNSITVIKSAKDLESGIDANNKNFAILAIEGASALGGKLENLEEAYKLGVRFITITWNGLNEAAGGCLDGSGLTDYGFELIKKMDILGVVPDVSHLSDNGMEDVFKTTSKVVMATHSNSREVCPHKRNLTDDEFKEIVRRGGVVGLNLFPPFIGDKNYSGICRHVDRFLKLGGENTIAFGSDFDGADMPNGIKDMSDMVKVYDLFVNNYGESIADRIFFDNAHNFVKTVLTDEAVCNNIVNV